MRTCVIHCTLVLALLAGVQTCEAQDTDATAPDPIKVASDLEDLKAKRLQNEAAERKLRWGESTFTPPTGAVTIEGNESEATGFSVLAYYEAMNYVSNIIGETALDKCCLSTGDACMSADVSNMRVILVSTGSLSTDPNSGTILNSVVSAHEDRLKGIKTEAEKICKPSGQLNALGAGTAIVALQALGLVSNFFASDVNIGARKINEGGSDAIAALVSQKLLGQNSVVFMHDQLHPDLSAQLDKLLSYLKVVNDISTDVAELGTECKRLAIGESSEPLKKAMESTAGVIASRVQEWSTVYSGLISRPSSGGRSPIESVALAKWIGEHVDYLLTVEHLGGHADHIVRKTAFTKGTLVSSGQVAVKATLTSLVRNANNTSNDMESSKFLWGEVLSAACYRGIKVKELTSKDSDPISNPVKCHVSSLRGAKSQ